MKSRLYYWCLIAVVLFVTLGLDGGAGAAKAEADGKQLVVKVRQKNGKSSIQEMTVTSGSYQGPTESTEALNGKIATPHLYIKNKRGEVVYSTPFSYPVLRTVPPVEPGTAPDDEPGQLAIANPEVTLVLPYVPEADSVEIVQPGQTKPADKASIKDARIQRGQPAAKRIKQSPNDGVFNLLIMASGYDDASISSFEKRAEETKALFYATEPFKSARDKVNIHIYKNTQNMECNSGASGIARLMTCNDAKVMAAAMNSGYDFDEIIVIHNYNVYSGSGMRDNNDTGFKTNSYSTYCVIYDGPYTAVMALHEFGHSFGNLCDEYSYTDEGYSYFNCVNCRADKHDFDELLTGECQVGCDAVADYFRPEESVMYTLARTDFNQVSIKADYAPYGLEKRLAFFQSDEQPLHVTRLKADRQRISVKPGDGTQLNLAATYEYKSKEEVAYSAVWESDDTDIAIVSQGYVTGVGSGTTTVTASYGGKKVTIPVIVETPKSLTVSRRTMTLAPDETGQVKLIAAYADGTSEDVAQKAGWSSADEAVATVEQGVITAIGEGSTRVKVMFNNHTFSIRVTVKAKP